MVSDSSYPASEIGLLKEITDSLETVGIDRYDYQLHDSVDVEALERLLATASSNVEVSFVVQDVNVTVDSESITVTGQ